MVDIQKRYFYCSLEIRLVGNLVNKYEFFKFISNDCVIRTKIKQEEFIVFCMSSHHFSMSTGSVLKKSGVVIRTKTRPEMENAVKIVSTLLETFDNAILLVSHIAKRALDKHSATEQYQGKVFCYTRREMITNYVKKTKNYKKRK
ncbi:MAG: hypothetical protein LBD75_00045 [Candidatus Peribacteria bacterium]|jgi:hypothetical protein|nr:hypothetical protein [Candidatus Peribacteria bacterium]